MKQPVILDSFALLCFFHKEPGWEKAEIKAEYPMAYADAFCVATALRFNGQIVTSAPEFRAVEKIVSVIWLAAPIH